MENDVGMRDIAHLIAPDADIVAASNPEPVLRSMNVVAVFESDDTSRNAVLALEDLEDDDSAIGLTALGHESRSQGVQPEDQSIAGDALRRAAKGAAIGAVVSAFVIGGATALISVSGVVVGAALGGALFGAFVGGVWGAFLRFGGSDAYRQAFVQNEHGVSLVSLHTNDATKAQEARDRLAIESISTPMMFRRDGDRVWAED